MLLLIASFLAMELKMICLLLICICIKVDKSSALLEAGISRKDFVITEAGAQKIPFHRSAYRDTDVEIRVRCGPNAKEFEYKVEFVLRSSACDKEYVEVFDSDNSSVIIDVWSDYTQNKNVLCTIDPAFHYSHLLWFGSGSFAARCSPGSVFLVPKPEGVGWRNEETKRCDSRRKREDDSHEGSAAQVRAVPATNVTSTPDASRSVHPSARIEFTAIYLLIVIIRPVDLQAAANQSMQVEVFWRGPGGFLSPIDWPLLPFYGAMSAVYGVFALAWLIVSMCQWRDLLRLQFWIGAVIVLGMLEKAIFYAEFQTMHASGQSVQGAIQLAEVVSCVKKTLARMLVIIVSVGFGVVRPRLGSTLHKVVGVGFVYFLLCSIDGVLRASKVQHASARQKQLVAIPLTLTEVFICAWIFSALVNTTRALRLRRNEVKLSLYRHFTNTLIFAVLASVAYMVWSLVQHSFARCLTDWGELWVDEAFWHLLFSVLLLVIMILWRPSNNSQRYAFSPLLDPLLADDDDDEDAVFSSEMFAAPDAMKLRGTRPMQAGGGRDRKAQSSLEDELKWVDEHIPSSTASGIVSLADRALPALVDSDEELEKTRMELSKMQ